MNSLHFEMIRQFATEIGYHARNLAAISSLLQVAKDFGSALLVEAHWGCLKEHARRVHGALRQWGILGISLDSLRLPSSSRCAALVQAAVLWSSLADQDGATRAQREEAITRLRSAALGA